MSKKNPEQDITQVVDEQFKDNVKFLKIVEEEKNSLVWKYEAEEIQQAENDLYKNIISRKSAGLKNVITYQLKIFDALEIKYPKKIDLINSERERVINSLNKNIREIFPEQHSVIQEREVRKAANLELYNSNDPSIITTKKYESQIQINKSISAKDITGNAELDSKLTKITAKHQSRTMGIFAKAKMHRKNYPENNLLENQERLKTEIQDLKADIYSLFNLKNKANTSKELAQIDLKIKSYIKEYEDIVKTAGYKERKTGLEKNGEVYKFLMNNSADRIARIMEQTGPIAKEQLKYQFKFEAEEFLKEAHPNVVLKIQEIQNKLEKRTENLAEGKTGGIKESIDKFFNKIQTIIGYGVKKDDMVKLQNAMLSISNSDDSNVELPRNSQLNKIKETLNKFTNTSNIPVVDPYIPGVTDQASLKEQAKNVGQPIVKNQQNEQSNNSASVANKRNSSTPGRGGM